MGNNFAARTNHCANRSSSTKALAAKISIRAHVLDQIGAANADVCDLYAGQGGMYSAVWHNARSYIGCDELWFRDARRVFVLDNCRVLRAIDLQACNVFDFDAFGSPWEQLTILSARRRVAVGERVGLCVTDGSDLTMRLGKMPHALALLVGLPTRFVRPNRQHDHMIDIALRTVATRMGARIEREWTASTNLRSALRYFGLVLVGVETAEA